MPIVHFHLAQGQINDTQKRQLLERATAHYAQVLASPLDRVRVFLHLYQDDAVAVAGKPVAEGGRHAPYFEFLVLEGRPRDQIDALQVGFTDLLVELLGVARELVRGRCHRVLPEDWFIGGDSAANLRAAEIDARAKAAKDAP